MGSVCLKSSSSRKPLKDAKDEAGPKDDAKDEAGPTSSGAASAQTAESPKAAPAKATAGEELQQVQAAPAATTETLPSQEPQEPQESSQASASQIRSESGPVAVTEAVTEAPAAKLADDRNDVPSVVAARGCSDSGGGPASPISTAEGSRLPGYESEHSSVSGSDQRAASEPMISKKSINSSTSISTANLDMKTSRELRKYAKRNRPDNFRERFNSQPPSMLAPDRRSSPSNSMTLTANPPSPSWPSEETSSRALLPQKMTKYDIFDEVDADRLKEFDDLFEKVVKNSNYQAHKKRTKNLDKNKFSTASCVTTDQETGQSSIT